MEGFDNKIHQDQHATGLADASLGKTDFGQSAVSKGSSVQTEDFKAAIDEALQPDDAARSTASHTEKAGVPAFHIALNDVDVVRSVDLKKLQKETSFTDDIGAKGDFLIPGAGKNTVVGTADKDLIDGRGGGFNTIKTGGGKDSILLDDHSTNRILDFDPNLDRLLFTKGIDPSNLVIAQGKNTAKDGSTTPLDSINNTLIIDKSDGHILASLDSTKASALQGIEQSSRKGFSLVDDKVFGTLNGVKFDQTQDGDGQLSGTSGRDKLTGGKGDDSLFGDSTGIATPPGGASGGAGGTTGGNDHDHAPKVGPFELHADLNNIADAKTLDAKKVGKQGSFKNTFGDKGDFLNPGGGNNTVIAGGGNDVIRAAGHGFNTITTGTGNDTIILGKETTNRILDFDPTHDHFDLQGVNPNDIIIAQGKNPGKGGLQQPLDSVNNTLIIDKNEGHILASLPFVKSSSISESNFSKLTGEANESLRNESLKDLGFKNQRGDGQLNGTQGHDRLIGGKGDDFLYVGNDGFKFNLAQTTSGADEFPFKNDSAGSSQIQLNLKDGVLTASGSYKDFNAFPLFSQGEKAIDPNAKILNGSDPVSLINNFLKVPNDKEGNPLSGSHLHFSPSGDDRGNFADATVVRYFTNTVTDAHSGTLSATFHLAPDEQAALLAGDLYMNIHTNINPNFATDGKSGFPTGENRINFNKDVVQFV